MPRARSASVTSTASRRTSRGSVPTKPTSKSSSTAAPTSRSKPASKATKPVSKGGKRAASVAPVEEEDDDAIQVDHQDDTAPPATPSKRKTAAPKAPIVKKLKLRVPIAGINPLPTLFPTASSPPFTFPLTTIPPASKAPRRAFVFGNGDFGQHGLGTEDNVLCEIKRPRPHAWVDGQIQEGKEGWEGGLAGLVCGGMHTLALDGKGRVYSWGINDNAALGRRTDIPGVESETLETTPMLVEGLEDFSAVRVAAGDSVSLALSDVGELRCWGSFRGTEGLLGFNGDINSSLTQLKPVALPNLDAHTIVQVATGNDHFLALTSKGQVFACGSGEQNQLGRKIIQRHKTHGLTPERLALKNIVLVGSGAYHSFAVSQTGTVYAWGLNSFHQTGVSDDLGGWEETIATPTPVTALDPSNHGGAKVVQIAGGEHSTVFLFDNGEVYVCGRCDEGTIGLSQDHPEMKEMRERETQAKETRAEQRTVEQAKAVAQGLPEGPERDLLVEQRAAQAVPLPNPYVPIPTQLSFPDEAKIINIASSARHSFAVSAEGKMYAFGFGATSELGLGDEDTAEEPEEVKSVKMAGFRVIQAATGGQHSIVLALKPEEGSA